MCLVRALFSEVLESTLDSKFRLDFFCMKFEQINDYKVVGNSVLGVVKNCKFLDP